MNARMFRAAVVGSLLAPWLMCAGDGPAPLTATVSGEVLRLSWTGVGTLEAAPTVSGPWTPVAVSSPQTLDLVGRHRYFRRVSPGGPAPPETPDYGYDLTAAEGGEFESPPAPLEPPPSATVDLTLLPPVGRQGTEQNPGAPGSCAAWSSTYGLATFTAARRVNQAPTNATQWASPAAIFVQVLQLEQQASNTCAGSRITSYFQVLAQGGTPSLADAPYVPSCPQLWTNYGGRTLPPDPAFTVSGFRKVATTNLTFIKRVLASGGALAYATGLYTDWSSYRGQPVPYVGNGVPARKKDGGLVGHCMLIIGYDDTRNAMLIQNSEGSDWGGTISGAPPGPEGTDAGYVWMDYTTFQRLAQGEAFYVP
ncbi:MAG: C1 family peptidase [Verrucomicrobia bacterium]|nr:C1 family peptidase [Verrucomicrobiota bacterium]